MNELTFMRVMLTELAWSIYIKPLHISECGDISLLIRTREEKARM